MTKQIYLDFASATPLDGDVLKAMEPYFSEQFYNPSGLTLNSKKVHRDIEVARQKIAGWLGARPQEIVYTAGGTESTNLAVHGVMQAFPGKHVVVSTVEHEAVMKPAERYNHTVAPVEKDGRIDLSELEKAITKDTVLVSVMYVNNEIGTIQPLRFIEKILQKIRAKRLIDNNKLPLYFHSDACQAGAYLDLHVDKLGVDLLSLNGGKLYAPKQSGILYIKTGVNLLPQIVGGGQELGRRSGTENVAFCIGLAKALDIAQSDRSKEVKRMLELQNHFYELLKTYIPAAVINGSQKYRIPNNMHITLPGTDNERLLMQLDEQGIQCAVGSACSASSDEPSHVLKAIGIDSKLAQSSLRFSLGKSTTAADLDRTVSTLRNLLD